MQLTKEEKIKLVTGHGMWHTNEIEGKVKALTLSDGPHGLRKQPENEGTNNESIPATCYPTAVSLAATWDTELIAEVASAIADEAIKNEVSIVLGPGTNIKRSPFGGRNFEYFSEDPHLSGKMAASYIRSMEGRGVGTSLKHFAGNSQETYRMTSNSRIDERALREIYLRAFELGVKEGKPATIMASYNRLNGKYACENKELLTDILRTEWGFDGVVVSDWGACTDLPESIRAGMDLEMPDSIGFHVLKDDPSCEEALTRAADNIAALAAKYSDTSSRDIIFEALEAHDLHAVAKKAAESAAVLLKNDGILPIKSDKKLLIVGELAQNMRVQGGGSSHINIVNKPDAVKCFGSAGLDVKFAIGYKADTSVPDRALEDEALKKAEEADIILFFGGLTEKTEGEGFDRKDYDLPENETGLIDKLTKTDKPVIFIGFGGSPYAVPFFDKISAFLNMGLPGEAADEAVLSLVTGKAVPGGKLAESWPLKYEDVPCADTFAQDTQDVDYKESIFVGYRYYDTFNVPCRFDFGYGLSYSEFKYDDLKYEDGKVSFTLTNVGEYEACEIAQVYIKNPEGDLIRENKSLRGFKKVLLTPGESRKVSIDLDDRSFMIWSVEKKDYVKAAGEYVIEVSSSLHDVRLSCTVKVEGPVIERNDRESFPSYFEKAPSPHFDPEEFYKLYAQPLIDFTHIRRGEYTAVNSLKQLSKSSLIAKTVLRIAEKEVEKMFPGRPADDPELMMYKEGMETGPLGTVAIQSGGQINENILNAIVEDANGHFFKAVKILLKR